jgi:hypothetical protein
MVFRVPPVVTLSYSISTSAPEWFVDVHIPPVQVKAGTVWPENRSQINRFPQNIGMLGFTLI